ncbi:D-lyxose/D-mannose family sugar isomerase [bacterium]|nr:D-lyxose/D-mannose family sugar isomerase [bacterium]
MRFHRKKTEDIINRGGGNKIVEVYKASEDDLKSNKTFDFYGKKAYQYSYQYYK